MVPHRSEDFVFDAHTPPNVRERQERKKLFLQTKQGLKWKRNKDFRDQLNIIRVQAKLKYWKAIADGKHCDTKKGFVFINSLHRKHYFKKSIEEFYIEQNAVEFEFKE